MVSTATDQAAAKSPEAQVLDALQAARERTLTLVAHLGETDLTKAHSPIMSPLVWDLGHIAAYEDLWLAHRSAGLPLLRADLAAVYDAFETPRAVRGDIEILGPADAFAYMRDVRARVAAAIAELGVGDETICEMVIRHELQHTETMRQAMALAGLLAPGEPPWSVSVGGAGGLENSNGSAGFEAGRFEAGLDAVDTAPGSQWVECPAGAFELGAGPDGFAYDNERARHRVELDAFQIARRPVSNREWARFAGAVTENGNDSEARGRGRDPDAPVCHVSWFQADEYARSVGARLPSEAEWERAAGAGLLDGVGQVWEWTGTVFDGYPGFEAYPYREYSEVFFDRGYMVLRGGSWATSERVKTLTFRNWDLPERSQIFAGVRLAKDAA